MYRFETLENTEVETLHQAFLNAFLDYQVKMDMPIRKFQKMLERKGYIPGISMGAFEDGALVGFIFNGLRKWDGRLTVHDLGTAVVPGHRKKGITGGMFERVRELVKLKKAECYLLEVIQSNTPAVNIYKKQGFEVTRDFTCFLMEKSKFHLHEPYQTRRLDKIDEVMWGQIRTFWDALPSWQNSIDSINAVPDTFAYSVVYSDADIAGYGVIDRETGDIPQIAVNKQYRRRGIAKCILSDLIKSTESNRIAIINVDAGSETLVDFCYAAGFEHMVDQYEMVLEL